MAERHRDPREELRQFVSTGTEAIRACDPALGALLDREPPPAGTMPSPAGTMPPPAGTMPSPAGTMPPPAPDRPLLTHPALQRLKRIALRVKPLHPMLRRLRSVLIRVVIRARDPALGALLDREPPPFPGRPLLTHPALQRLKRIALRVKPLHPALRRLRSVLIRVRSRMRA